jgi:hypothetical protein
MRLFCTICFALCFITNNLAKAEDIKFNGAELRAVDKITGRTSTFSVLVGDTYHFGSLSILPYSCVAHPPEETPENKAFLDISETKPNKAPESVFRGWMFSSSPAISAMEHPVYDIWVLKCLQLEDNRETQDNELDENIEGIETLDVIKETTLAPTLAPITKKQTPIDKVKNKAFEF